MDNDTFHSRLKYLMHTEGLDEKTFAQRINRTLSSISRYLAEGTSPRTDFVLEVTRVFPHWSAHYLLVGQGEPHITREQAPKATLHYAEAIRYWLKKKEHMRRALQALPNEAHQALWIQAEQETIALLADIKDVLEQLEKRT